MVRVANIGTKAAVVVVVGCQNLDGTIYMLLIFCRPSWTAMNSWFFWERSGRQLALS